MLYAIVFACKPPFSILPTSITFYASPSWWSHFCTSAAATLASMGNPTWGISIWPGLCQTHEWFHEISWAFTPWIWIKRRLISFSAAHWNLNKLKIKKKNSKWHKTKNQRNALILTSFLWFAKSAHGQQSLAILAWCSTKVRNSYIPRIF